MTRITAENCLRLKERPTPLVALHAILLLAKPRIVAAVALLGFTGMVLGGKGLPTAKPAVSCLVSLILMAAGSTLVNSVLDHRTDRLMARLALRTAALERVGTGLPLVCAAASTAAALAIASAELDWPVVLLLSAASLGYAVCYSIFLKPNTHWAAVLGGIPGALPALIGSAAVGSATDPASLMLFLVLLFWQPPHFWLLSMSHTGEYQAAGVPVLALVKGDRAARRSIHSCVRCLVPVSLSLWFAGPCSAAYALCALLLGCSLLFACRRYLKEGLDFSPLFRGTILYLLLLLTAIIVDLGR